MGHLLLPSSWDLAFLFFLICIYLHFGKLTLSKHAKLCISSSYAQCTQGCSDHLPLEGNLKTWWFSGKLWTFKLALFFPCDLRLCWHLFASTSEAEISLEGVCYLGTVGHILSKMCVHHVSGPNNKDSMLRPNPSLSSHRGSLLHLFTSMPDPRAKPVIDSL